MRSWIAAILLIAGTLVGWGLVVAIVGSTLAICVEPGWTPAAVALALALQQIAALMAFGIAWGIWHAVGPSAKRPQPAAAVNEH